MSASCKLLLKQHQQQEVNIYTHSTHNRKRSLYILLNSIHGPKKMHVTYLSWCKLMLYLQELTWEKYPTKLTGKLFGIHELVFCKIFSGYGVSNVILDLWHVNEIKMHQFSFSCGRRKEDDFKHLL